MPETYEALWRAQPQPALLASRDLASGELVFPPLPADSPLAARHETVAVGTAGRVYSHSLIHPSPKSGQPPYAVAFVDLAGPLRVFGRFGDGVRPAIGSACRVVPDVGLGWRFVLEEAAR